MTSVGEILRTERENQGREISEIAKELCVTQSYLRAIEQDDLRSLPGVFFYKSFARQYAALLGLDEKQLRSGIETVTSRAEPLPLPGDDARYPVRAQRSSEQDGAPLIDFDTPAIRPLDPIVEDGNRRSFSDRRMGLSMAGLVAVLLGCSGFYAWWNKAPQSKVVSAPHPVRSAVIASAQASEIKSETASNTGNGDKGQAPAVDVTSTTDSEGHVVLNLAATEETWLSITSDGKQIFSGVLQPSQTKTLTGLEAAKLRVGNAGGLEVRWNGKPIGPIGPRGQVRVILFTPENFQILEPSETL